MNLLLLSVNSLRFRAAASLFNVLVLALGIALILTLLRVGQQAEQRFDSDLEGIDLVVGAKGSPLQLILSSVFHLDVPTGNIPLAEAQALMSNRLVKSAIPVALGDSYHGFRIVGTTPDYPRHYDAVLAQGAYWTGIMETVLGAQAANASGLKVGDRFAGTHGLSEGGDEHTQFPYRVTGILQPTGTVADRLIFTDIGSVWNVHEHPDADEREEQAKEDPLQPGRKKPREITALLISYKSPLAAATLPRLIDKTTSMQAASPAVEMHRLWSMLGIGGDAIRLFGMGLIGISAIGFFITLLGAVSERAYDLALLRALGAGRGTLFGLVLLQGLILGAAGLGVGLALGAGLTHALALAFERSRHVMLAPLPWGAAETTAGLIVLAVSLMVSLIPAVIAYRTPVSTLLMRGA